MKAIIEIGRKGSIFSTVQSQLSASQGGVEPDYYLRFESARTLFSEITPSRLDLLEQVKQLGSCSIYALAKASRRNYANVHADTQKLLVMGLLVHGDDGKISVPFDEVDIRYLLSQKVA